MSTAQSLVSSLFIADDAIQTKVNLFLKDLKDMGYSEEDMNNISESLMSNVEQELELRIIASMDDEDTRKWQDFVNTKPNSAQEFMILDKFLKNKIGKGLEELQNEIIVKNIDNTLEGLKLSKDIKQKISQLSEEEIDQAQQLLDQGRFEDAQKIINKLNVNPQ